MATYRVHKTRDYTVMSNSHFREKEMSLKAKGLLSLMLSLPDEWDYSIAGLVLLSKDGKDSVMSALSELEEFGYLIRTRRTNEKGQFDGYDYDIFETPQEVEPQTEKPQEENPNSEKPNAENPNTEKPLQLNTHKLTTKKSTTKKSSNKDKKKESRGSFDEIITEYAKGVDISIRADVTELLFEWLKVRKAKRSAMTDRAIQMNIDKLDKLALESNMSIVEYLGEIICRGWSAFYPIKNYENKPKNNQQSSGNPFLDIANEEGLF